MERPGSSRVLYKIREIRLIRFAMKFLVSRSSRSLLSFGFPFLRSVPFLREERGRRGGGKGEGGEFIVVVKDVVHGRK